MRYVGADIGYYNDIDNGAKLIEKYGGNLMQVFIKNNQVNNSEIKIIVHASYTINLCNDWDKYSWWILLLLNEIDAAIQLKSKYIVLHFGKSKNLDLNIAYNNMYTSLVYVCNKIKELDIIILLELPAGQGTEICSTLESLQLFYSKIKNKEFNKKIKICLDTCHVHASGYSLNSEYNINKYLKEFDDKIGLQNIKLIHLNDSKYEAGKKLDRHEALGLGTIGLNNLIYIYKFFILRKTPIILETPGLSYKKELKLLINI